MFKKILLVIVLIIAAVCAYAATKPDDYRYARSATINAPAEVIFPEVNTAKSWEDWSPWAEVDPEAVFTYEGPASGPGAISRWKGNMEVGEGTSTITESRLNEFVKFKLDFIKPMAGTATAEFTFKPEGSGTNVTWTMYGKNNFIGKLMSVVMDCEAMMNEQFDKGLAGLKGLTEKKAAAQPAAVPAT